MRLHFLLINGMSIAIKKDNNVITFGSSSNQKGVLGLPQAFKKNLVQEEFLIFQPLKME